MKHILSNLSALAVLVSFVLFGVAFILSAPVLGLCAGCGVLGGVSLNLVVNCLNLVK